MMDQIRLTLGIPPIGDDAHMAAVQRDGGGKNVVVVVDAVSVGSRAERSFCPVFLGLGSGLSAWPLPLAAGIWLCPDESISLSQGTRPIARHDAPSKEVPDG